MLELCWNATKFDVTMSTVGAAKHLAGIISKHGRVQSLTLSSTVAFHLSHTVFVTFSRIIAKAFRDKPDPRVLDHLVVDELKWASEEVPASLKKLKRSSLIQARNYSLTYASITSLDLFRIIPSNSVHLRALHIETSTTHLRQSALGFLAKKLPRTLEVLSITCAVEHEGYPVEEYPPIYPPFSNTSCAPDAFFTSFPNLVQLTLGSFRKLTLAQITLLSEASPHLRIIDLDESTWVFDCLTFDVAALRQAFDSNFPCLKQLNLGTLPLYDFTGVLDAFELDLSRRGIVCEWTPCEEDRCECDGEGCYECMGSDYFDDEMYHGSDCECGGAY